jgi:probable rRNA maturation factor
MTRIEVFREGINLPYKNITRQKIKKIAAFTAERLDIRNAFITIIVTDDAYIMNMNREFRGLNEPTDVISFSNREIPFPEIDPSQEEIGDIYISLERAEHQSIEYRETLLDEVKRLIIHGILHLIGFDHERSDEDEALMLQKEDEIIGFIDV